MKSCVVDTSVAFKWFRQFGDEDYVREAIAILESHLNGDSQIHIPCLLIYELGNILRFKEDLASESAISIIKKVFLLEIKIHAIDFLFSEVAFSLARKYAITFYDASFLALSHILNCPFITADEKLYTKIKSLQETRFLGNL